MKTFIRPILITFLVGIFSAPQLMAEEIVDLSGTWKGSYHAAFPSNHSHHHESSVKIDMELDIYRQDGHLMWIENRWRPHGQENWNTEFGTGVLSDIETGTVYFVEINPSPDVGSTGVFEGKYVDGKLHLVYLGIGKGISFSVVLERK